GSNLAFAWTNGHEIEVSTQFQSKALGTYPLYSIGNTCTNGAPKKEESHGGCFSSNFGRSGRDKLCKGSCGRSRVIPFHLDLLSVGAQALLGANDCVCGFARRAISVDCGSVFWDSGVCRRVEHLTG